MKLPLGLHLCHPYTLTSSLLILAWVMLAAASTIGAVSTKSSSPTENDAEKRLAEFLAYHDKLSSSYTNRLAKAKWNYDSDLTSQNKQLAINARLEQAKYLNELIVKIKEFDLDEISNSSLKRQLKIMSNPGISILSPDEISKVGSLRSEMEEIFSSGKVCFPGESECLRMSPGLKRLFSNSTDWDRLTFAWKEWRKTGVRMRQNYSEMVEFLNKAARINNFKDEGDYLISEYETDDFKEQLSNLWQQVKPLYQQLHTYVRRKLTAVYGEKRFPANGLMPGNILGNLWGQGWGNVYHLVVPYANATDYNVDQKLKEKGYNATSLFKMAEEFFVSIGLPKMTDSFWKFSIFERPRDNRSLICHASAWDFSDGQDFRIKMCTDVTMQELITVHHEMGHIQYMMLYSDLPKPFRDGANPGFHEAVGDTISLSVCTPQHLSSVGLIDKIEDNKATEINFLMRQGLSKIGFLPFGYLVDQWRWQVFSGETSKDHYNRDWWRLICKYQGISPPVQRSESDFDPGAKYHIPANVPYIRYFISYIIQFQFHESLCKHSGYKGALHKCDIGGSKAAGEKLRNMLRLGYSKPWPQAMRELTGQTKMDATSMLNYFQPLMEWLEEQNRGEDIGWNDECSMDTMSSSSLVIHDSRFIVFSLVLSLAYMLF